MCNHDFIFQREYDGGMPNLLAPRICKFCLKAQDVIEMEDRIALDAEIRQAYKTLGRMCELSNIVCSWAENQNNAPYEVQVAAQEIMQYVKQVSP